MNISIPSTFCRDDVLGVGIQHVSSSLFQLNIRYMLSAFLSLALIAFILLIHNWRKGMKLPFTRGTSATQILPLAFLGKPEIGLFKRDQFSMEKPPLTTGLEPCLFSIQVGLEAVPASSDRIKTGSYSL